MSVACFAETKSCGTGSFCAHMAISYFDDKVDGLPIEFKSSGGTIGSLKREHLHLKLKELREIETFGKFLCNRTRLLLISVQITKVI